MKILLTGGGTAGHFYPLIAIVEEIHRIIDEEKLVPAKLYYMSTTPYDKKILFDNDIAFRRIFAGKARLYFSLWNVFDLFKIAVGVLKALWSVYLIYPDVVVSKGGYASTPAVLAAKIFRIPVVIHESDSVPGRSNVWASRFAQRIAISWPEAAEFFPKEKTAVVGQPVRKDMLHPVSRGAYEFLKLEPDIPVILILGGSQGAKKINEKILDALPILLQKYQIIHQTGEKNEEEAARLAQVVLEGNPHASRYHPFGFLKTLAFKMAAGVSVLVISRAGSTIFEIAAWKKPSILIPLHESNGDHQRKNAYNYARTGACIVIEEGNLSSHVLSAEIDRVLGDPAILLKMQEGAESFFRPGAAEAIARETLRIALGHEK